MFDQGPAGLLTEELRGVVGDLDPDLMGADDADRLLGELIGVVQLAEGAIVRLVRRALESGAWRASGDRSPRHHLARRLGTSLYATDRLLETTARLDEAPQIAEAVAAGALSSKQTQLVARAGALAPDRQEELLGAARRERLVGLRDLCDRIAAAADERTDEQRHSEARRSRYVRSRNLPDGTFVLELRHTTTVGAELTALLEPFIDAEFDRLRDEGIPPEEREPAEAVAADAVVAMARAASADSAEHGARPPASGAKAKVIVRVDRTALLRGRVEGDEVCEVTGLGPVPVTAVRELMEDAFIAALLTDGTDIRSVVHLGRQPTALQRTFPPAPSRGETEGGRAAPLLTRRAPRGTARGIPVSVP